MVNSLVSGLAGLRVHQQLIDVVGNNLANSNTPGYKSSRATFSEILTQLLRLGSAPTSTLGGSNPVQIGLGVRLGTIDMNMSQGSFLSTGRTFDMGLQGSGFFVVNNGTQDFYTRAGTFGLDSNNDLIDLKNGYKVKDVEGEFININTTSLFPPNATENLVIKGNLPAQVLGPKPAVLESQTAFSQGASAILTGTAGPFDFSGAGSETMTVSINGGSAVTITFEDSNFATLTAASAAEVSTAIFNDLSAAGVTGQLGVSVSAGAVVLTTVGTGDETSIQVTNGTGNPATELGLGTSLTSGSETEPTTATTLNSLPDNTINYVDGDLITISGTAFDGDSFADTFIYGSGNDGTTLGDLINFINGISGIGATAELEDGNIVLTAGDTGETSLSLTISDNTSASTGRTSWSSHTLQVTQAGTGPDQVTSTVPVFDSEGNAHNVTLTFTRQETNLRAWDLVATIPDDEGSFDVGSETISNIQFTSNGAFNGSDEPQITITFGTGANATSQTIRFDFGDVGSLAGLTHLGNASQASIQATGDGYSPGTLSTISVRTDGVVQGVYTNGQLQDLGAIGIATFSNPAGLQRVADTLFAVSTNSGTASISGGLQGAAGEVRSGVLENSNVEIAEEFVKLVEAQRGFQASAKVIQTTDQILGDLNQIV